jgi:hypothetical protein
MTAVEFLESKMTEYLQRMYKSEIEQAKEIEKQQIIDAYASGYIDGVAQNKITAEEYYEETFNK